MDRRSILGGIAALFVAPFVPTKQVDSKPEILQETVETYTFRRKDKFFDVHTYTGTGQTVQTTLGWAP
jgi:hypothetical protein